MISDDEIDAFILFVCSSEKIRNPLSYETKLREQIQKGHKPTLYALADFLRKRELEAKKSEYERLTNRYFASSFEYQGVSYVFVRVGLCRDDVHYAGRFDNSDHVFLELYKNGNSESRTRIIFENLEVCKNYLKGVCDASYRYIKQVLLDDGSLVDNFSFIDCDSKKKACTLLFNLASHGFLPSDCVSLRMTVSNKNPDDFIWVRDVSFLPPPVEPKVVVRRKKKTAQSGK